MKQGYTRILIVIAWLLVAAPLAAQTPVVSVSGTVVAEESGEALPGVSVVLKGTATGTTTDAEGRFSISLPSTDGVLVFSYIGFAKKEVPVQDTPMRVVLETDAKALGEVVVIGYGEQSRETVTGSISRVGAEEFENAPAANPLLQLQGKIAGVSIQASSGQPGANPEIFIRGGSSTSPESDAPLIIVDGIVGVMRNISDLNPDDIESVQVLKDAASTAIYGARAANGVIIVKTKSGKAGKTVVNFKFNSGIEQQGRSYDFTSARDYIHVSRLNTMKFNKTNPDFFLSGGGYGMSTGNPRNAKNTLAFLDTYISAYGADYVADLIEREGWETMADPVTGKELLFKETNYQDVTFQTAYKKEYDVNVSGGNDRATYYVGLGHLDQEGIVSGTYYKNYNALFNGNYRLSDKWSINSNISYQLRDASGPNNYQNVLSRSVTMPFTYRLTYEDGTPAPGEGVASFRNRNHEVYYRERHNDIKVYRSTFNLGADWDILPGLSFSPSAYYFTTEGVENYFEAANEVNSNRSASANHNFDRQIQLDGVLNYDKMLTNRHHVNAILGSSYINTYTYRMSGSGRGAPTDYIPTLNATSLETQRVSTTKSDDIVMSYFGRVSYDYDRRFLFAASLRMDGSSRFAEDHKWGFFPGVSAGWNIHNEEFWQPLNSTFSTLKLRTSWGQTGNNALSISDSQGAYSTGYNYLGEVGILNTTLANRNLVWETTTSFDAGIDVGVYKDRIKVLVDYYNKVTSDRLFGKPLDATSGFSAIRSNFGSIRNRGVEVELAATPVATKSFSWDLGFTYAFNRSTVVELPDNGEEKNRTGGNTVFDPETQTYVRVGGLAEGERFGGRWAYNLIGVYATDEEAADAPYDVEANGRKKLGGDAIWEDVDGNGRIDHNDMVFMGYMRPDQMGGIANTLRYKNFTMRMVADYAIGHVIDNSFKGRSLASARNNNMTLVDVLGDDIWKEQGDQASIPKYTVQSDADYNWRNHLRGGNSLGSTGVYSTNNSLYFSKGDFLAFREVSLSYLLDAEFLKRAHIQSLEFTGSVHNMGYITAYDGLMPEVYTGADQGSYPRPLQYNMGVRVKF
jgi:TonB-linked SusC/RagA family outer membrane protein